MANDHNTPAPAVGYAGGPPEPFNYERAAAAEPHREATTLQKVSWVLNDWANSGYGLIVISAVFPPYFLSTLLPLLPGDPEGRHGLMLGSRPIYGSAVMALLTSFSMALMALGAPVLGAVADIRGWTKRLLTIFSVAGAVLAMLMCLLTPGRWVLGAVLFVASNFCFGTSFAFGSAFLPHLTRPEKQGSLSGWGFAAGYIGGAVALVIALWLYRIDPAYTRWGLAMSGAWWLVFGLPAFIFLDEMPPQATAADRGPLLSAGFRRIKATLKNVRHYKMLFLFLLAFLLYNDGVETVIAMSSSFGTDVLRMDQQQLIVMLLIVQFVAFLGAVAFGYLADRIGDKRVIVINLLVWILAACLAFFVTTAGQFTLLGVLVGVVLGGVQASSRCLMGKLAPAPIRNEAFGFFSISGKFASIFGPLLYALFVTMFNDPKFGILSVLPFLVAGLVVLWYVRGPESNGPRTGAGSGAAPA